MFDCISINEQESKVISIGLLNRPLKERVLISRTKAVLVFVYSTVHQVFINY